MFVCIGAHGCAPARGAFARARDGSLVVGADDEELVATAALPLEEREEADETLAWHAAQPTAVVGATALAAAHPLLTVKDVRVRAADEEEVDELLRAVAIGCDQAASGEVRVALDHRDAARQRERIEQQRDAGAVGGAVRADAAADRAEDVGGGAALCDRELAGGGVQGRQPRSAAADDARHAANASCPDDVCERSSKRVAGGFAGDVGELERPEVVGGVHLTQDVRLHRREHATRPTLTLPQPARHAALTKRKPASPRGRHLALLVAEKNAVERAERLTVERARLHLRARRRRRPRHAATLHGDGVGRR